MERNTSLIRDNSTLPNEDKSNHFFLFRLLFYPLLIVVGSLLNGMVIIVLKAGHLKLSYVYRYLLINLAFADIGVLLLAATVSVLVGPAVHWRIGETLCRLLVPVGDTLIPVSSGTLFLLAVARYRAIKDPFAQQWSRNLLLCLIACNWLASFLFAVTPLQVWIKTIKISGSSFDRCYLSAPLSHVRAWYATVIAVLIIPTLTSLWLIVLISKRSLRGTAFVCKGYGTNRTSLTRRKENKQATQLIMATSIVYTVLVMPYFALTLALRCGLKETTTVRVVLESAQVLFYSQCAIDPVLYCLINKNIRRQMFQTHQRIFALICKLFPRNRSSHEFSVVYMPKGRRSTMEMDDRFETCYVREAKTSLLVMSLNGTNRKDDPEYS